MKFLVTLSLVFLATSSAHLSADGSHSSASLTIQKISDNVSIIQGYAICRSVVRQVEQSPMRANP